VGRKFLGMVLVLGIVGGTLAMSKPGDAAILTKVGSVASRKIEAALPESSKVAGPVNALRNKDFLAVGDRVQVRIRTDKSMEGANVVVIADGSDIKLRGDVKNTLQRIRAVELAQSTAGVDKVTNEIVEPAQ
jgi:osmotically-inducible protein OsmY